MGIEQRGKESEDTAADMSSAPEKGAVGSWQSYAAGLVESSRLNMQRIGALAGARSGKTLEKAAHPTRGQAAVKGGNAQGGQCAAGGQAPTVRRTGRKARNG